MPYQATPGDVPRRYERTLQARGHWFEPSCAHQVRLYVDLDGDYPGTIAGTTRVRYGHGGSPGPGQHHSITRVRPAPTAGITGIAGAAGVPFSARASALQPRRASHGRDLTGACVISRPEPGRRDTWSSDDRTRALPLRRGTCRWGAQAARPGRRPGHRGRLGRRCRLPPLRSAHPVRITAPGPMPPGPVRIRPR